jgi:hypothetical protein
MPDDADAADIVIVSVDDHVVRSHSRNARGVQRRACALVLAAALPVFDLLTSPSV